MLTQQGQAAGQDDDHESNPAKAEGQAVGLGDARLEVALVVAGAHSNGERGAATVHAVRDDNGQMEDGLLLLRPASAASQDPCRVVWTRFVIFIKTTTLLEQSTAAESESTDYSFGCNNPDWPERAAMCNDAS